MRKWKEPRKKEYEKRDKRRTEKEGPKNGVQDRQAKEGGYTGRCMVESSWEGGMQSGSQWRLKKVELKPL